MRPVVRNIRKRKQSISVFRGINRGVNTAMSRLSSKSSSVFMEFKDTKNVCLDDYPAIRTRDKRTFIYDENELQSNILATDKGIVRVAGSFLYVGERKIQFAEILFPDQRYKLVEYGNFVVVINEDEEIVHQNAVVNLVDGSYRKIENHFVKEGSVDLSYELMNTSIKADGEQYIEFLQNKFKDVRDLENQKKSDPENTVLKEWFGKFKTGDVIEDKSTVPSTVYLITEIREGAEAYPDYYNNRQVYFTRIDDVYTKVSCAGIGKGFKTGDGVRIRFEGRFSLEVDSKIIEDSLELLDVGEDYIVIKNILEQSQEFNGRIEVHRQMPCYMDFMVSCNNRLWACSNETNTVYASKLGDPTNWEAYFAKSASDSYFAEIGSEGEFTGITTSGQSVYFFKENCIHRFYGSKPTNFSLTTYLDQGVKKGSGKSIIWLKDRLFYNSPSGVCVYSPGGEPQLISEEAFGGAVYTESVAGKHGGKYVISLKREDGVWELFIYDTENGQWILDGNEHFGDTTSYRDVLYFRLGDTNYLGCMSNPPDNLLKLEGTKELLNEGELEWLIESGDLYDVYNERKYIQKIEIIMELLGGSVSLWFSKDGLPFERVKMIYSTRKKSLTIPLYPGRCHNFRLKLEGRGKAFLYNIQITTEEGSDNDGKL